MSQLNRHERRALASRARKAKKVGQRDVPKRSNESTTPESEDQDVVGTFDHLGWNELHQLYRVCNAMFQIPGQVTPIAQDRERLATVNNPQRVVDLFEVLSKDVAMYRSQLEAIYSRHRHRVGQAQDGDETIQIISLGEEYNAWQESFNAVVLPLTTDILSEYFDQDKVQELVGTLAGTNETTE